MWPRSPAQAAWHLAISELVTHQGDCQACDPDGEPRCPEGRRLYDAEQAAWMESRIEQYAGRSG